MSQQSWFFRKIGYLFAVTSGKLGPSEWAKILHAQRAVKTHRVRRRSLPLIIASFVAYPCVSIFGAWALLAHSHIRAAIVWILGSNLYLVFMVWMGLRVMRGELDQTTLEDRALMEYGTPFAALEEQQRVDLYRRQTRGDFRHDISSDERETRLRLYSTDAAYRILSPSIAALIAAYWAFCLLAPFTKQRITLLLTAVVFTWIAVAIIALPTLIRSWTEPDDPGEPKLVPGATHN
jgi:hypothetical protein